MGYDSDHPAVARARSGSGASPSTSLADMERLFAGIPLDEVTTSMTINAPAAIMLALLRGRGRAPGRPAANGSAGTIQNDILKEYIAQKEWCFPPRAVACG